MSSKDISQLKEDPTAVSRKKDHIEMAFKSAVVAAEVDGRFYYEPMLSGHPNAGAIPPTNFLGFELKLPMWISSMTGGTEWAATINSNLAKACGEFGMGMGLGSCRTLLFDDDRLHEFDVKRLMPEMPLYANLGVAQIEELVQMKKLSLIPQLIDKLSADGLIMHINPLQEWLQPEGDRYYMSPVDLVKRVLDACPDTSLIVKEVGQGFGPQSLKALYELPIAAVDFGASGGTNFALLELLRSSKEELHTHGSLAKVGHTAEEMIGFANEIIAEATLPLRCSQTIISGGVKDYLDGYYAICKLGGTAIYGQASSFLRHARGEYEELRQYVLGQKAGLEVAYTFLTVK